VSDLGTACSGALLPFLAALAVSCGSGAGGPASNSDAHRDAAVGEGGETQTDASGSCKAYVACELLSVAEIDMALGNGLAVTAGVEADTPGAIDAYACGFSTGLDPSVAIGVNCSPSTPNVSYTYSEFHGVFKGTAVMGLGEAAYFRAPPGDAGSDLVVFFGEYSRLTISLTAPATVDHEAVLKGFATTALARL
jgi:hypothetical protein